ncbi:hypothetical protein DdX_16349 [Ditylenchus destructor]|uniref:Uncharacterized protein n=1 Tax=Ditylenchus destructor TaxID=166010 RepID=A0AAD4QZZ4_9BILA|nr:hypothetical protein DdX_16349 [Ditylenchus destructor]
MKPLGIQALRDARKNLGLRQPRIATPSVFDFSGQLGCGFLETNIRNHSLFAFRSAFKLDKQLPFGSGLHLITVQRVLTAQGTSRNTLAASVFDFSGQLGCGFLETNIRNHSLFAFRSAFKLDKQLPFGSGLHLITVQRVLTAQGTSRNTLAASVLSLIQASALKRG